MQPIDRDRLADLLERLGEEKDEDVLAAARDANRMVAASGRRWRALLVDPEPNEGGDVDATPATAAAASGEKSPDLRLIERLLARKDISDTLRADLQEFKRALAAGELDQMDADYLRALARRLGA